MNKHVYPPDEPDCVLCGGFGPIDDEGPCATDEQIIASSKWIHSKLDKLDELEAQLMALEPLLKAAHAYADNPMILDHAFIVANASLDWAESDAGQQWKRDHAKRK